MLGLGLVGYGSLILIGLTVHESTWIGISSLLLGALLLWRRVPKVVIRRAGVVRAVGVGAFVGTLGYNLWQRSGLGVPEWTLLGYGILLVVSSFYLDRRLGRVEVSSLVAWSFPLLLAPLMLFASNAAFTERGTQTALGPLVHALVVVPTSLVLQGLGTPVETIGNSMIVPTDRGALTLGVGLVCAGLYPMILYAALLGLHAWQSSMGSRRFAKHLSIGIVILWLLNILRIVIVTRVGIDKGMGALQTVHAHIGWILFTLFISGYWGVVHLTSRDRAAPLDQKA